MLTHMHVQKYIVLAAGSIGYPYSAWLQNIELESTQSVYFSRGASGWLHVLPITAPLSLGSSYRLHGSKIPPRCAHLCYHRLHLLPRCKKRALLDPWGDHVVCSCAGTLMTKHNRLRDVFFYFGQNGGLSPVKEYMRDSARSVPGDFYFSWPRHGV